jgi:hypothetical protein
MALPLSADALAMLDTLAAPIDQQRRPAFLGAVTAKLEAGGPAAVGEGSVNRAAREVLSAGGYWNAPLDLRAGRVGPRGPRG